MTWAIEVKHRLESKSEWSSLMPALRDAAPSVVDHCLSVVRRHCVIYLDGDRFARLAEIVPTTSDIAELAAEAAAADNRYLDTLESRGGAADSEVMGRFARARALVALVATYNPDPRAALMEGAYELSAISRAASEALRSDVAAALALEDRIIEAIREKRADAPTRIDMYTIAVPALYPVADEATIRSAEQRMECPLPALLRRLYAEVGNGGFGPGGGLIGLDGGYPDAEGRVLPVKYEFFRSHGWREQLLPLWDWGCGAWSCVDATTPEGSIVTADENGYTLTAFVLRSWLEAWVEGVDLYRDIYQFEHGGIINPFTRQPMAVICRGRARGTLL